MENLSLLLFERMGMLLILIFILTRFSSFRQLIEREFSFKRTIYFSLLFGLFGILGTYAGIIIRGDLTVASSFWIFPLQPDEAIAHSALVGVVIGGLTGGMSVGLGAGLLAGLHLYYIGGYACFANAVSVPIVGFLAGLVARLFLRDRVVPPAVAFFCGAFAPIIQMGNILIFEKDQESAIRLVNTIAIPMMLINSISIAVFMMMLRVAMYEEERAAAFETQRALHIAELALPHLKQGLNFKTADAIANMLVSELKAAAIVITDTSKILSYIGIGASNHIAGERLQTEISRRAIATGVVQIAYSPDEVLLHRALKAVIVVPFSQTEKVAGLIQFYFRSPRQIRKVEIELAKGLGKIISYQLDASTSERMAALVKETELRMLQAQINPHFLFNTLNSIISLIRLDQDLARHATVQLGLFMRYNLKLTSAQLISIREELDHLNTYLELMKLRFAEHFHIYCEIDPHVTSALIPPATIQPLVENSIKHGLKFRTSGSWVRLEMRREDDKVRVVIEDNGTGIPEEFLDVLGQKPFLSKEGNGIGVFNVNQRLLHLFGSESFIKIGNKIEGGSRLTFVIPFHGETIIKEEAAGGSRFEENESDYSGR